MTIRNYLVLALLAVCVMSYAQEQDPRLSEASIAASEAQTKRIQQELRKLKSPDWAGEYFFGDGLGVNVSLALAPRSGFVFSWHGCLGLYDLNYGDVSFTNGIVRLLFRYPNQRESFAGIAPEFVPVRWGQRHYLIPPDQMVDFANAINAGTEPSLLFGGQSGSFLLRRGDERKAVAGLPSLPNEFLSYILPKPVRAKIFAVDQSIVKKSSRTTTVTIDAGSADGLKKGMELFLKRPSSRFASANVTSVSEHSSTATIKMGANDPAPSVGWELSTKL